MPTKNEAIAYLTKDGAHLGVPCSRYGRDSGDCAPVAYALAVILAALDGDAPTEADLDYAMGLVVNDHDDVAYVLRNYGPEHGFDPADYLDSDDTEGDDS